MKRKSILKIILIFIIILSGMLVISNKSYAAVKISSKSIIRAKGTTYILKVNGTKKKAIWYSSNRNVATVDKNGRVTVIKKGTAVITAKIGSKKYKCTVKAVNPKISKRSKTIIKGKTYDLKVSGTSSKVTWSSSNKSIAKVNSKGKVTAVKKGTATITSKVNGKKLYCTINVVNKGIAQNSIAVFKGRTYQLTTYGLSNIKWNTSNKTIATVDKNGLVTGKKKGTTIIYAISGNKTYTCTVAVKNEPDPGWKTIDGNIYYYYTKEDKAIGWQTIDGRKYYFNKDGVLSSYTGIDVSSWQENIDWNNVKNDNIDFAIIRVAGRGYGKDGNLYTDKYFDTNIKGATSVGIKIAGFYFFSQAINEDEAVEEADYIVNLIKPYNLDCPIIIDTEYGNNKHTGRADSLSKKKRTVVVKAFCEEVKLKGYVPMIYASKSWFINNLNMEELNEYRCWVAQWETKECTYNGEWDIWQYTDAGSVAGITGRCDMDVRLKNNK